MITAMLRLGMIFETHREATPNHNAAQRYRMPLSIVLSFEDGQLDFEFSTKNSHASVQREQS